MHCIVAILNSTLSFLVDTYINVIPTSYFAITFGTENIRLRIYISAENTSIKSYGHYSISLRINDLSEMFEWVFVVTDV